MVSDRALGRMLHCAMNDDLAGMKACLKSMSAVELARVASSAGAIEEWALKRARQLRTKPKLTQALIVSTADRDGFPAGAKLSSGAVVVRRTPAPYNDILYSRIPQEER